MTDEYLDDDGYPTEAALGGVRSWPIECNQDAISLLHFVATLWWGDLPKHIVTGPVHHWGMATWGWSGNEDLIGAMMENNLFWLTAWQSSRRGGHYTFEIAEDADD